MRPFDSLGRRVAPPTVSGGNTTGHAQVRERVSAPWRGGQAVPTAASPMRE